MVTARFHTVDEMSEIGACHVLFEGEARHFDLFRKIFTPQLYAIKLHKPAFHEARSVHLAREMLCTCLDVVKILLPCRKERNNGSPSFFSFLFSLPPTGLCASGRPEFVYTIFEV